MGHQHVSRVLSARTTASARHNQRNLSLLEKVSQVQQQRTTGEYDKCCSTVMLQIDKSHFEWKINEPEVLRTRGILL